MKTYIAVLLIFNFPCMAQGAFTDFSDLNPPDTYFHGDSFNSNGINFSVDAIGVFASVGAREISSGGTPGGIIDGAYLSFGGANLTIQIPIHSEYISFNYLIYSTATLTINGNPTPVSTGSLAGWDDITVSDVDINIEVQSIDDGETGTVTLLGPIQSLSIYGLEFAIDNLSIQVPEPSATALLLISMCVGLGLCKTPRGQD